MSFVYIDLSEISGNKSVSWCLKNLEIGTNGRTALAVAPNFSWN